MYIEPTVSLKDGLALYVKVTRELASRLPPGPERDNLIRRAQWANSISHREDWANAVGSPNWPEESHTE